MRGCAASAGATIFLQAIIVAPLVGQPGRAVVFEPQEVEPGGWKEVPPYSFCTFAGGDVRVDPFLPCRPAAAA